MTFGTTLLLWLLFFSIFGMIALFFYHYSCRIITWVTKHIHVQRKVKEAMEKKEEQAVAVALEKQKERRRHNNSPEEDENPANAPYKKLSGEAVTLLRRGEAMVARKDFNEAKKIFLKILAHDEGNFDASSHLAYSYLQTGDYTKAEVLFKKVMAMRPADPSTLTNYALCLFELKNPQKAEESALALKKAAQMEPNNPERFSNLGQSLFFLKDFEGAQEAFEKAIKIHPRNSEYLFFLADTFLAMEKKPEAKQVFEKIVDIYPLNEEAKNELRVLVEEGF